MKINEFVKGTEYNYSDIESLAEISEENIIPLNMIENGAFMCGERFIVLKDENSGRCASFVLTGMTNNNSVYECIYTDYNNN